MAETPDSSPSGQPEIPAKAESLYAQNEKLGKINVAEEIKGSFLDYSMSVIVSRALPDVRDGLKPSQRRILYAMHDLSLYPNRQHRKCAKICGDTSGNWHPHGEAVIYPTLVHMAQHWVMRDPLVDGQGNFGSVEGDPPAAMRYTEARMTHLGSILMKDMEQDTVDFVANYDETKTEPTVFPAAFPNLLINGATGIAVGMATNIPPHNLGEVIDGICAQIDNPEIGLNQLMKYIKGPDFPTGCSLCGLDGIKRYFASGKGSLKLRGRVGVEQLKGNREQIVITEIPFNVNRATLVERIADLVNEKTITEITALRDESDENTRVVIELKRDAIAKVVINNLYKYTQLENNFAVNMLAIDHGKPKTLSLKEMINCFIEHRREVVLRRTRYLLRHAEERAETLEGFIIALSNMDDFIRIIRESKTREEARIKLLAYEFGRKQVEKLGILIRSESRLVNDRYAFSEKQADAILELRLYQLTGLEHEKIQKEYADLTETIKDLQDILAKESRVLTIIKDELMDVKKKYATPRKTDLVPDEGEIAIEDLIANEGVIITLTHAGLIKRTNISSYRSQKRGGKGVIGMTTKDEDADFIEHLFAASTHDYLMFITTLGRCYVERVHEIPDMGRASKGRSIANILQLRNDEKIAAMLRIQSKTGSNQVDETWSETDFVLMATSKGTVKKTALKEFSNIRKGGIIAINIDQDDRLIEARLTHGNDEVVLITREGMSIRFHEEEARPMGRATYGVRGITLDPKDQVVALAVADPKATLLVAGENAIGKRTSFEEYRRQSRGGKGIITMKTNDKTGGIVGALCVTDDDDVMLITDKGQLVRISVKGIREAGRNTQGVKLMDLRGDKLQAIAQVISEQQEDAAETDVSAPPTEQ